MFASKVWSFVAIFLVWALQVNAHAAVSPALGVAGTPKRSDVKSPNTGNPCGQGVNIAKTLDQSTAVVAAADGSFTATAINFNAGADGSRSFTAAVDAAATGKKFVAATVTQNGDRAPAQASGSQGIVAQLPSGTKCTGGASKNKCLVQFRSTSGFGNCVVVQQGKAAAAKRDALERRQSVGGTRAARALLAEIEERGEEAMRFVRRGFWSRA